MNDDKVLGHFYSGLPGPAFALTGYGPAGKPGNEEGGRNDE